MFIFYSKYINRNDDFKSMILDPKFENTLFLFNDNVRHHETTIRGGGNASIRPYNEYSNLSKPRSAGIVTGDLNGFQSLNECKELIDICFDQIQALIVTHEYKSLMYSTDSLEYPIIGSGIFTISSDVKSYITKRIYDLGFGGTAHPIINGEISDFSVTIDEDLLSSL